MRWHCVSQNHCHLYHCRGQIDEKTLTLFKLSSLIRIKIKSKLFQALSNLIYFLLYTSFYAVDDQGINNLPDDDDNDDDDSDDDDDDTDDDGEDDDDKKEP